MADGNSKKRRTHYKEAYDKQVRFEAFSRADDYTFIERYILMASAADEACLEGYSELTPYRTRPYRNVRIRNRSEIVF